MVFDWILHRHRICLCRWHFGSIAAFGLNSMANFLQNYSTLLHIVGGLFLSYLGIQLMFSKTAIIYDTKLPPTHAMQAAISAFFITLTNPVTIFSFMAFFCWHWVSDSRTNRYNTCTISHCRIMLGSNVMGIISQHQRKEYDL